MYSKIVFKLLADQFNKVRILEDELILLFKAVIILLNFIHFSGKKF